MKSDRLPSLGAALARAALPLVFAVPSAAQRALVLETDYGTLDGAVAEMKGVAFSVDRSLRIFDLTHQIPPYDIWEAAYRLKQTAPYWPSGTVFVCVVDPGVGTSRRSVVMRTKTGQFFVSPDNGTLTLVADELGVSDVREIDERVNRRPGSAGSYTFHGRDVYVYTGARLAVGIIRFEQVGPSRGTELVRIPYQRPMVKPDVVLGNIPVLDPEYGNVWTNIGETDFARLSPRYGQLFDIRIRNGSALVWSGAVPYARTFGDVPHGQPLLYVNSLGNLALALNQGDFARTNHVGKGGAWSIEVRRRR